MPLQVRYHFTQRFAVSAQKVFEWCTDFGPNDHALMGEVGVERQVTSIADGTMILKDIFHTATGVVEKEKLVQLYPDQLAWVSTHLTGPNKYSQFLYRISADGKEASILDFTGLHLDYQEDADIKLLAQKLCLEDAAAWKLLARAMKKELGK
ncbi:MAG: hypothetical protein ABSF44_14970 [Candidatus Bathyarchaeia archaeon]|jgi:hypothetical protein